MNKKRNSKRKWLPSIGLASLLILLIFIFLYRGETGTVSGLLLLIVCTICFSFLFRITNALPDSGSKEYTHDEYGWENWQVVEMPTSCPECNDPILIQDLHWTGPEAARCPSCGNQIDVQINLMYKPGDELAADDGDSLVMVIAGSMYGMIGLGLTAVLWSADPNSLYFLGGVAVVLIGFTAMAIGIRNESPYRGGKCSRQTWQVAEFPIDCQECGHPIEVYKLAWVGPKEVHCPYCSTRVDFDTAVLTGARLKPESR